MHGQRQRQHAHPAYAVDKATGERLGEVELPGNPRYGMMTYMHEGGQRVVIQAPNMLMAMSLP